MWPNRDLRHTRPAVPPYDRAMTSTPAEEESRRRERLAAERIDYGAGALADEAIAAAAGAEGPSPFPLFARWLEEAFARREEVGDLPEPSAVVLSTVDLTGDVPRPRSRTVLMKAWDERGVVVYTNKDSAKGRELAADAWASVLLPWYPLQRQVRIDGRVEDASAAEADAYWDSRPRASQLGAWASDQSRPVASRAALDARYAETEARFASDAPIPRPPHWGGYRLVPDRVEFWQGRHGRLHDRIVFEREAEQDAWRVVRLQP